MSILVNIVSHVSFEIKENTKTWKHPSLLPRLRENEPHIKIELDSCICRPCNNSVCLEMTSYLVVPRCNDWLTVTVSNFFGEHKENSESSTDEP